MKRGVGALTAIGLVAAAVSAARAGNVSIGSARTTPVQTSTADGVGPGDVTITGGGSVTVSTGPAVTLDSSNTIINNGTIQVTSDTNAVGVLVDAGNTGSYSGSGTINAVVRDSSNVATGSGNVAFWVSSTGTFIGNITLSANSLVEAGGTNSVGVLVAAPVQGTIEMGGAVTAEGTGSVGFENIAAITGDLKLDTTGSIAASGQGARAVVIAGAIDGALTTVGPITAMGAQTNVSYTSLPTSQAQFALGIGSSISGGFGNSGVVTGNIAQQGVIISPTLASVPADITLGEINVSTTPYGVQNTGTMSVTNSIAGQTVSGLLVEGATIGPNTYNVLIQGGIDNTSIISGSTTADGGANGIDIGNHATVPAIVNSGTISGAASGINAVSADGVLIEAGASVPTLTNSGTISASASSTSSSAVATAILDQSGTLATVTNSGHITVAASGTTSSSAVAIDLRQSLGAVSVTNSGEIAGDVLLGDHNNTVALIADGDGNAATTSTWTGTIAFGAGSDNFTISGAGVFSGNTTTAGTLAIQVNDGVMALGTTNVVQATTVDFATGSALTVTLDPATAATPRLTASDHITFESGAKIEATLNDFVGTDFTAIVAEAPTINATLGAGEVTVENLPFLYTADPEIVTGAQDQLEISLHLKNASDLGLSANQAAFYGSVLDILSVSGNALATPLLAQSDAASFFKAYDELMPMTSQPTLNAVLSVADDVQHSLQDRETLFLSGDKSFEGPNGWWSGAGRYMSIDKNELGQGIDGTLVSATVGADDMFLPWLLLGAELTYGSSDLYEAGSSVDVVHLDTGQGAVYGSLALGPIYVSGSAGGGSTTNRSVREFKTSSETVDINGTWGGTFLDANAEAGLNAEYLHAVFRPWVGVSWLRLDENAYHENGGGTGFDLAYDATTADVERARAGVILSYTIVNSEVSLTPEVRATWSELLNDPPATLHGSFVDGAVPFDLSEQPLAHEEIIAGFGFTAHGKGLAVSLGYDATIADGQLTHNGKLEVSTQF